MASQYETEAGGRWPGLGNLPGVADDQRQHLEKGRDRPKGGIRPTWSRARGQHGNLYDLRHGPETRGRPEARSGDTAARAREVGKGNGHWDKRSKRSKRGFSRRCKVRVSL